ncbi:MAG TPA: hypothetical protein VGJ59_03600 [Jatrophihabitantaceae bacterium]
MTQYECRAPRLVCPSSRLPAAVGRVRQSGELSTHGVVLDEFRIDTDRTLSAIGSVTVPGSDGGEDIVAG